MGGTGSLWHSLRSQGVGDLQVVPFLTPATGVRFNRFSSLFNVFSTNAQVTVAVYDSQGHLIVRSDKTLLPSGAHLTVFPVSTTVLNPSSLYYVAWTSNDGSLYTPDTSAPGVPGVGFVNNIVTNAVCPNSFDPANIANEEIADGSRPCIANTGLFYDER
jgi:hypothetical protein